MSKFKLIKSDILFKGKVFDLKVDEIKYDSTGNTGRREVAIHPGGAVVVAVTNQNKIIMVRQFRYPFQEWILELPAGKLDNNEEPQLCAERELTEETGYSAGKISKLGHIYTTPGFCNEILHIYLAENLTAGEHAREEGEEGMEIFEFTIDEIKQKIASGEIVDAKTISGIMMYLNKS
ncbi:MAG: NUDIX hydrolase [Melioribacteraceae bacterium]|nr:NUDIX hydrolase [Melioribacteraceae bacterium]